MPYEDVLDVDTPPPETRDELRPVQNGHDVWIGTGAAVMGWVTIGDEAIVACRSVVTRDVEPYTVVGVVSARPIRRRFADTVVERLLREPWWRYDLVRTTHPILWRDPLRALDAIAAGVETGAIQPVPTVRHRITRDGTQFSVQRLT